MAAADAPLPPISFEEFKEQVKAKRKAAEEAREVEAKAR